MTQDQIPTLAPPSPELLTQLVEIVGPRHAVREAHDQIPFLTEWRERYRGRTPVVLKPGTVEEVSRIAALCNSAHVGLVPQGGNTGLVGGQIPSPAGTEIVLSLQRLNRIRGVDPAATSLTAEAGVTLAEVHAAAEAAGRLFPLSLASEGSCSIGGNLATNAGGVAVLAYGNARNLVLGLEVVMADGRIWNGLRVLKKDNTGYDLRDLFIGSEGTLGIITAATLKLLARPREKVTALAAVTSVGDLLPLFRLAEEHAGGALTAFEFMSGQGLAFVLSHIPGTRPPFQRDYPWLVLIELSSGEPGRGAPVLERILAEAQDKGIAADATIAASLQQADALWRLREAMSEAQKGEGGSIKHDISVPLPAIADFIAQAGELVERLCPGARPVPFGHFGDGNIHYNVSQPAGMEKERFLALWEPMQEAVHGLVAEMEGSISAEHGIGQMKRDALRRVRGKVELDLMRSVKQALDPNGILNPGKVL